MNTLQTNNASPLYIASTLMPQIIPLLTLASIHTLYENFAPGGVFILQLVAWEVGSREAIMLSTISRFNPLISYTLDVLVMLDYVLQHSTKIHVDNVIGLCTQHIESLLSNWEGICDLLMRKIIFSLMFCELCIYNLFLNLKIIC